MKSEKMCRTGIVLLLVIEVLFVVSVFGLCCLFDDAVTRYVMSGILILGSVIFSCAAIRLESEYLKCYYEYRRTCAESRIQEYKFSKKLIDLISSEATKCAIKETNRMTSFTSTGSSISLTAEIWID